MDRAGGIPSLSLLDGVQNTFQLRGRGQLLGRGQNTKHEMHYEQ